MLLERFILNYFAFSTFLVLLASALFALSGIGQRRFPSSAAGLLAVAVFNLMVGSFVVTPDRAPPLTERNVGRVENVVYSTPELFVSSTTKVDTKAMTSRVSGRFLTQKGDVVTLRTYHLLPNRLCTKNRCEDVLSSKPSG